MTGKTLAIGLAIFVVLFGAALFYFINFAHYSRVQAASYELYGQQVNDYRAINAQTSPIKYRGCFGGSPVDAITAIEDRGEPTPLVTVYWFDCFDAAVLVADLAAGAALARRIVRNEPYGIDHYMLVYPDGNGVAWRQMNECGEARFGGKPIPATCPRLEE